MATLKQLNCSDCGCWMDQEDMSDPSPNWGSLNRSEFNKDEVIVKFD
jgi:hypothetical protein